MTQFFPAQRRYLTEAETAVISGPIYTMICGRDEADYVIAVLGVMLGDEYVKTPMLSTVRLAIPLELASSAEAALKHRRNPPPAVAGGWPQ